MLKNVYSSLFSFFTIHDDSICLFNVNIVLFAVCDSKIMFRKLRPISLKVHSHQTRMMRMTRIAQKIYMLSQCKDAKDNPAARMARIERSNRAS